MATTTSKSGSVTFGLAVRPLSGRQPQYCDRPPSMGSLASSTTFVRRATTMINPHTMRPAVTVPVAKTTPLTNASIEASRVLAAVTMDLEADAVGSDSSKMPTVAENKVFLEPSGKRRKKEPAVYNEVRGDKKTATAIASDGELRQLAMRS